MTTTDISFPGYCGPAGGRSAHFEYDLNVDWHCRRNSLADTIYTDIEGINRSQKRLAVLRSEFRRRNLAEHIEREKAIVRRLIAAHAETPCTCPEPYAKPEMDAETALPACCCGL